jgi:endonuclease/exonuclease/phosphatase family metal-dependent hydrolase
LRVAAPRIHSTCEPFGGAAVLVTVVSYNIHRAIGMDRRFRPSRVASILRHHDADIVLLQEVDDAAPRSGNLDLARELAEELDYPHYAVGHNVTLRRGRYGNATLSRWPILRERNIDLTVGSRKRRGCQHTSLCLERISGHPHELEVFNLHLGLSPRERAIQIGRLVHSAEFAGLDAQRPCLVGGDFNDWRARLHPIFTEVLDFSCATERRSRGNGTLRTFPSFSPTGGIDRLYYRGALRLIRARVCRLGLSRVASDHLPVSAEFELH